MILIPFNNLVLYPALRRFGLEPTALRRMTAGIAFSGLAGSWSAASGGDGRRQRFVDLLADPAVCIADLR